jgi:pilus assembly protein CpaE
VLSPKGGVGKTFVSTNLSVALGSVMPNEVAVVDLDLQFGDIASALRILPEHTVSEAARSATGSDATMVKVFLTQHESGIYALCAPDDPADADEISYEQSSHIVRLLSTSFPIVLVDTAAGLDPHTLSVAEISTDLVFVCSVDVASVRSLRKEIDALDRLGMTGQRRHLVLNRIDAPGGARPEDVEVAVGLDATISVPTDRTVLTAANQGTPLLRHDPKSPIAKKFVAFAETFAGVPAATATKSGTLLPWRRSR